MNLYAILGRTEKGLDEAVSAAFPADSRNVGPGQWIVAANNLTTKEVADKVGLTDGAKGFALVTTLGNYYGWHESDLWEWLQSKKAQNG